MVQIIIFKLICASAILVSEKSCNTLTKIYESKVHPKFFIFILSTYIYIYIPRKCFLPLYSQSFTFRFCHVFNKKYTVIMLHALFIVIFMHTN